MQGIQVLYWALSILFCMAMGFAILLWCRGWRREEEEEAARRTRTFSGEIARLVSAVEALQHTAASLQTADEQFTQQLEGLRGVVAELHASCAPARTPPGPGRSEASVSQPPMPRPRVAGESPVPKAESNRYTRARSLLAQGRSHVDVARMLDIGVGEVRTIAGMMSPQAASEPKSEQSNEGNKEL